MLSQFVERVQEKAEKRQLDPSTISVEIFEKQDIFGPGFPHSDRFALPFHITNMCASDMGILYREPGDFQNWVEKNHRDLTEANGRWDSRAIETVARRASSTSVWPGDRRS